MAVAVQRWLAGWKAGRVVMIGGSGWALEVATEGDDIVGSWVVIMVFGGEFRWR